jgi:hypothetical protein
MACKVTGGAHIETDAGHDEATIGPEIVTFARIECSACGAGIRNEIYSKRPNPDYEKGK